jgi:hypothetical protein
LFIEYVTKYVFRNADVTDIWLPFREGLREWFVVVRGNLREREHSEDLGLNGSIILTPI